MTNYRFPLAGDWSRSIGGRQIDFVRVPGCYRPVGECVLEYGFARPWPAQANRRYFLVTEGVLASAEFTFNGQALGRAGPWTRQRLEIPADLWADKNTLAVRICDAQESFGPPPGRRFDAGLVRAIYIESRPTVFLKDFCFQAELNADCTQAKCTVAVEINGADSAAAQVVLSERGGGRIIARAQATPDQPARFSVESPRLWSPSDPDLYTLTVTLEGAHADVLTESVGFRRIEARGRDFYLNNKRLLLKGVCRHEFTSRSGYSPSAAEVRRELALIKHAGFNFVRLVHSPQGPEVSRIAAELGLLVSEEPGTCFHDLADPAIYGPALECLGRTVKRDRNVPSIFAWLIYNECNPNSEYAMQAAEACRALDPGCRLGFADCSGKYDDIKAMVQAADLTFYGINVYGAWPAEYEQRMRLLADRPLVFTEWGGVTTQGNWRTEKTLCDMFVRHSRVGQTLRLAGCSYWAWADYEERSRPGPAAVNGWTIEGLLDQDGQPRPDLHILSMMCFEMDHPPLANLPRIEVLAQAPRRTSAWQAVDLTGIGGDQSALEKTIDERRSAQGCARLRLGKLLVNGIEFVCRDVGTLAHPLLLGPGREEIYIPIDRPVRSLAVLGHAALRGGFPRSSIQTVWSQDHEPPRNPGDPASEYELVYADGSQTVPLRHGLEILRGNDICRWWLTEPRGPETRPAVRAMLHPSYEVLRVDLWELTLDRPRFLKGLRWRLRDPESVQMLYAVSVEVAA
ncbi:MAG: hypothetical protein IT443_13295 [Phycisphaeraceae bacterium]|nr:hypothetical protein [Phycisphaeraceae bacterium]